MEHYPLTCIDPASYTPAPSEGAEVITAENGRPWIYVPHDRPRRRLEIVHPALLASELADLRAFYAQHAREAVIFSDPFDGLDYTMLMLEPPAIVGMASPWRANVRMILLEV